MKKKLMVLSIALVILGGNNMQAQGFLNKLGKAVEKTTKSLDGNTSKKTTQKSTTTKTKVTKSQSDNDEMLGYEERKKKYRKEPPVDSCSNLFNIDYGTPNGTKDFLAKFANFKKSASTTKVIELDNLSDIQLGYFHDGRAFVRTRMNGAYCIDDKGNVIKHWDGKDKKGSRLLLTGVELMPKFDSGRFIDLVSEEYKTTGTAVIYDTNFKVIKQIPNVSAVGDYQDGVACYVTKVTGTLADKYVLKYIDVNGNQVFKSLTDQMGQVSITRKDMLFIRPVSEGLVAFCVPQDKNIAASNLWGFRDKTGKVVIPPKYDEVQDFSNGLAAVGTGRIADRKWGYIDTKGNMVIPQKFSNQPSRFDNCGLAMVVNKDMQAMFINKQGEVVSDKYERDLVTPFCNGKALYTDNKNRHDVYSVNTDYVYLIDSNFKTFKYLGNYHLTKYRSEDGAYIYCEGPAAKSKDLSRYAAPRSETFFRDNKMYISVWNEGFGLLDDDGDMIIGGLAGFFSGGLAPVRDSYTNPKNVGYVNEKGEWIVKFERSEF